MYVSMKGIEPNSDLEKQIINAFVAAGAPRYEGRDSPFPTQLLHHRRHFGWLEGFGTHFSDLYSPIYSDKTSEKVSVNFILNGSQKIHHKIGDIVLITSNINGHRFNIGQKVVLMKHYGEREWFAESLDGCNNQYWHITEDEFASLNDENPVDEGGWIEWNGGECPVDGGTFVEVEFNGEVHKGRGWHFDWQHRSDYSYNIARYLVITPSISSQEDITDDLESKGYQPTEDEEVSCNSNTKPSVSTTISVTFTVSLKGQTFELTPDELRALHRSICDAEDNLRDWRRN